ncbi:unnamed protein product [Cylicocyclus nassatus]|uniref:Uncharacterized protein n=1 Tax=Cylicocyclus nassatus TaxID=53992 RepID=A0AA36H6N0_CYLNA|nr:unnamed protein product [Cylicocyclus nassatus]
MRIVVLVGIISTLAVALAAPIEMLEEEDIQGLEDFLAGIEDERTREAVIELLEAKQIADEKQVAIRMRRIIRQLPEDVVAELFELYKKTLPRRS